MRFKVDNLLFASEISASPFSSASRTMLSACFAERIFVIDGWVAIGNDFHTYIVACRERHVQRAAHIDVR